MRLLSSCVLLPFFLMPVATRDSAPLVEAPRPSIGARPPTAPVVEDEPIDDESAHDAPPASTDGCAAPRGKRGPARSIGRPTRGHLAEGSFLAESDLIHHVDAHGCNFWGTEELVGAVREVAAAVAAEHPDHRLTVGELSKRDGGDIVGHASHENGRDVDLGFYFVDEEGLPYEPDRLLHVRRDGTALADGRSVTFDVARNWTIVETLLTSETADVSFILVGWRIRRWLLAHARATGVGEELYRRASRVLIRPRRGRHPHRNHFHVRIYCPESHSECRDRSRLWDWVAEARARRAPETDRRPDSTHAGRAQRSGVRSASSAVTTASSRS